MKKTKMLKKNYEFSRVFSKGKYFSGENIEAFVMNNNKKLNYLGLAISVKSGKAYQRNRAKRLIRENYRLLEKYLKTGNNIVFLWKKNKDISKINYYKIKQDMIIILKKANIIMKSDDYEKDFNKNN